jgi:hypothetical protein
MFFQLTSNIMFDLLEKENTSILLDTIEGSF